MQSVRLRELDGLRGLAIVLVMLFHAEVPFLPGGFFGVDLFFVLSGYLITRGLMSGPTPPTGRDIGRFWIRRALRLLPALVLMLLVFAEAIPALLWSSAARQFQAEAVHAVLFVTNWARALTDEPSYFLGHTWSLAIEAQYYLIWPLILLVVSRRFGASAVLVVAAALAFTVMGWRAYLLAEGASAMRLFNGFDTRLDSLMMGSLLAALQTLVTDGSPGVRRTMRWSAGSVFAVVGLGVLARYGNWTADWVFLGGLPLAALAGSVLLAGVLLTPDSWVGRVFRWSPLSRLGEISYGVYLWHFPIFMTLFALRFEPISVLLMGPPIALLAASASYRWVERPVLALANRWRLAA